MRIGSEVVSLSWIPSEAIGGMMKLPFEFGFTHYDDPPPDHLDDLEALRAADRFRFGNQLAAWIDVDRHGKVTGVGYSGGVLMGSTTVLAGHPGSRTFEAFAMPVLRSEPEMGDGWARFGQTAGGRTGLPAPRRVRRPPFVQWKAPLVWSTLSLTLHADGRSEFAVAGASPFPRHWVYGPDGDLAAKTGLTNFKDWYRKAFGKHTPWGEENSPALVTAAETALERQLSMRIMRGGEKPQIRSVKAGTTIVTEGEEGTDLYLLLDGVVRVEKGGEALVELGPGAVVGERAVLEGGRRTSTLVAVTRCRLAVARADQIERSSLIDLSEGHRREERPQPAGAR